MRGHYKRGEKSGKKSDANTLEMHLVILSVAKDL